jgi:hypothetical protein
MKKPFLLSLALLLLFAAPEAEALAIAEYNITFFIMPDTSVSERVSMMFKEALGSETLNYVVLGDVAGIEVSDGERSIDYVLEKTGSEYNVKFSAPEGTRRLEIRFTARDLVFTGDGVYSFSTELKPPIADRVNIYAYLPEGYAIYRNVIYPEGYETLTDGEKIYLKWEMQRPENIMLSFKFYHAHTDYSLIIMAVMGAALIVTVAYLMGHYRKKVKREFERGFSEDERKVLFILSKERRVMQNKIEKELKFSRAKMTRLVKKLEAKGLVEKERVGRTNRLFYKK